MKRALKVIGMAAIVLLGVASLLYILWFAGSAACPTCGGPFK